MRCPRCGNSVSDSVSYCSWCGQWLTEDADAVTKSNKPLLIAMIAGRIVWGIVRLILAGLSGKSFTWALFLAGAFTNALPGIILHILLIPVLVLVLERAGLSLNRQGGNPQ